VIGEPHLEQLVHVPLAPIQVEMICGGQRTSQMCGVNVTTAFGYSGLQQNVTEIGEALHMGVEPPQLWMRRLRLALGRFGQLQI